MRALASARGLALAALLTLLGTAAPGEAAFHLARIDEILTSYGGDPTAQMVEIRMQGAGQQFVGSTRLATFDTSGTFVTSFTVPSNVTNNGAGVRWIMATASLVAAAGAPFTADFVIPAILPVAGGMVCWGATSAASQSNPNAHVDCIAYGTYAGPSFTLTGTPTTLDPVGHGLVRISDAFNNATAFVCTNTITPRNNAGVEKSLAATSACGACGNGAPDAGEACDDGANNGQYGFCNSTCSGPGPSCGDGAVNGPETCDDGNVASGDCCDSTCQSEAEGNACPDDGDACTTDQCNASGMCVHTLTPGACVDHYLCYKGGQAKGESKFASTPVLLTDQLEPAKPYVVSKVTGLCNPATKIYDSNTENPGQPALHYETYQIKQVPGAKFVASNHQTVDQFGTLHVTVKKPKDLHVRAGKIDLGTSFASCTSDAQCAPLECIGGVCIDPAFPPAPANDVGRDNFKCYQIGIQKGAAKFTPITGGQVQIDDQFSGSPLFYDVLKPTRLCTPVDKAGDNPGAEGNSGHLVCYQVKLTKFPPPAPAQPKFVKHKVAVANTNFADTRLDVKAVTELCVPALKDPP